MGYAIAAGGNGMGRQAGTGAMQGGTGTCVHPELVTGELVTITGTVSELGCRGAGISVDTGTEIVQVYGLGPVYGSG